MNQTPERKLAAIMFTDIVGYTDLMGKNESEAFELIKTQRDLLKPIINSFKGIWIKEMGDGTISSFNSAFEAANCSLEIQRILRHNSNLTIRIGIHIGDIIEKQLVGPSSTNWWDIKYNNLFNKVFGNNPRLISMIKKDEDKFRRESTYDLNIFMP